MSAVYGERFAVIPEWLLDAPISDRAVRLFGVLARYADPQGGAYPGRQTLSTRLRCSEASLDRAVKELVIAGAVTVKRRRSAEGDWTSNEYHLHHLCREVASSVQPPLITDAPTGGVTSDEQTRTTVEREPLNVVPALPATLTTDDDSTTADAVTKAWWESRNPRPAQKFVAVRAIVGRFLAAGHRPDAVRSALDAVPTVSIGTMEWELNGGGRPRSRAEGVSSTIRMIEGMTRS